MFVERTQGLVVANTGTDDRGEYRIGALPAGTYTVSVLTLGPPVFESLGGGRFSSSPLQVGAARVTVTDSDLRDVVVRTSPGSSIRGRIVFEPRPRSKVPNPSDVGLSPIPIDYDVSPQNNVAAANIQPNGSFVIEGINGPRRLEVLAAPPGWVLKDIRAAGVSVTDQVLSFGTADQSLRDVEVVLTDQVSELTGFVRDDRARPMASVAIIVFSADRSAWYPRSRHVQRQLTEADGSFSISGPPAGQ